MKDGTVETNGQMKKSQTKASQPEIRFLCHIQKDDLDWREHQQNSRRLMTDHSRSRKHLTHHGTKIYEIVHDSTHTKAIVTEERMIPYEEWKLPGNKWKLPVSETNKTTTITEEDNKDNNSSEKTLGNHSEQCKNHKQQQTNNGGSSEQHHAHYAWAQWTWKDHIKQHHTIANREQKPNEQDAHKGQAEKWRTDHQKGKNMLRLPKILNIALNMVKSDAGSSQKVHVEKDSAVKARQPSSLQLSTHQKTMKTRRMRTFRSRLIAAAQRQSGRGRPSERKWTLQRLSDLSSRGWRQARGLRSSWLIIAESSQRISSCQYNASLVSNSWLQYQFGVWIE